MADANPPVIGDAGAFERAAREVLSRAEQALRQSVQTLAEVRGYADQINQAGSASAGEDTATQAINRKADAAERAAAAVARQNAELRAAGSASAGEAQAAAGAERTAVAVERLAAAHANANAQAARGSGQGALFDPAGVSGRLFPNVPQQEPLSIGAERAARTLANENTVLRATSEEQARLADMSANAAVAQGRATSAMNANSTAAGGLGARLLSAGRNYGEFVAAMAGVQLGTVLFKDIIDGAKQSQEGVQDLERVLKEVNPQTAVAGFRELSTQYNVPIAEVATAQMGFARVTQDQNQALEATRAGLAATKLDAIGAADSVKYLTVAMQAFHLSGTQLSQTGGVFDQMENVSRRIGVPVGQIMSSFRGLPATANSGGDLTDYIALAAAAARASGVTGNVVGTAFQRGITNFIPRAQNQDALRGFGLDPKENFTQLLIDSVHKAADLNADQRRQLAIALAGPQLGSRVMLGLLNRPDVVDQSLREANPARASGAASEEMAHVMARVDQMLASLGRRLADLGSTVGDSGVLNGLGLLIKGLNELAEDLTVIAGLFNHLPAHGAIAPALEAGLAVAAARRFNVGERLPNLGGLNDLLTRPNGAARATLDTQRGQVEADLARNASRQASASIAVQSAANVGDAEAATRANSRLAQLAREEQGLAQLKAELATRTVAGQAAINAARERELVLMRTENGLQAEQAAVAGTSLLGPTAARGGGLAGVAEGAAAGGLLGRLGGGAAGLAKAVAPLAVYFAAFQQATGVLNTHGNALERLAGGGRSVLATVGIDTGPITNVENRAKGGADATQWIGENLHGGAAFNAQNEAAMNARREALTKRINDLDAQGGNKYRNAAQISALQAELDRETAAEQAAARMARARSNMAGAPDINHMTAAQLTGVIGASGRSMEMAGDNSGLRQDTLALTAFYSDKTRADPKLLQQADQALQRFVSGVTKELSDSLALARTQGERNAAYAQARTAAQALDKTGTPEGHRQAALLRQQVDTQQFQSYQGLAKAHLDVANAQDPAPMADALRTMNEARQVMEHARATFGTQSTDYLNAQAAYLGAVNAVANQGRADAQARITAQSDYAKAGTTDPVAQARIDLIAAQQNAGEVDPHAAGAGLEAAAKIRQARQALSQAIATQARDLITANAALRDASIDPGNQVAVADSAALTARQLARALPANATPAEHITALANQRKTAQDAVRARQQAAYDDITFNASVGKLTTDMEVSQLQRMLGTVRNNQALRRNIQQQIYQLTHQTGGDLSLNLGNLRLPTPYEVNRAITEAGSVARTGRGGGAVHNANVININVAHRGDVAHVGQVLDRVIGTSTRSSLRAAGAL